MIKKILILLFLMLPLSSCANFAVNLALDFLDRNNQVGKGEEHYKYKCKKAGECCEVGKDCEENSKEKKSKE